MSARWIRCMLESAMCAVIPVTVAAQESGAAGHPDSLPQRDVMDVISRVLHGEPKITNVADSERPPKVALTVLPAFSVNPTVGVLFGVSGNAVTRLGTVPRTNLSTISASVNYTTKKQFNVLVRTNVFTPANRWKLEGDWRYLDTNQPTYGLGPAQPTALEAPMDFKLLRFYETVYHAAVKNTLVGVGYHLNYYFDIVDRNAVAGFDTPFLAYNGGSTVTTSTSSGVSLNLLADTRDNPINATRGHYARLGVREFPTWLGSDADWQSVEGEMRVYPRLDARGRSVLGLWGLAWLTFGNPPYLELPAIGWDYNNRSGRGYVQGRIRANDLLYGEAEYRRTLSRDGMWGVAAFLNLTSASDPVTTNLQAPDVGGGVGLRVKLNKHSSTNITIDIGVGAKGSWGFFMGTGEAF